jgi:GT2 family glycosyltransferase
MLELMENICCQHPEIGVLSPQILGDGINNELARASTTLHGDWVESPAYIPFVCVYLPRRALDAVGPLDESLTGYNCDDVDWCVRAQRLGFKLAVTPLAKVIHGFGGLTYSSSFLRVMTEAERNRSVQEAMMRVDRLYRG